MLTQGQITPDSPFGQALTKYARQSERILEVGFGSGLGSTRCLMDGMTRPKQLLVTTEGDEKQFAIGSVNIQKAIPTCMGHVTYLHGVFHRLIRPYWHPIGTPQHKEEFEACRHVTLTAPLIYETGKWWDLVVLDGGEYSSDADLLTFWEYAGIFALDDLNPELATKNCYAATCLEAAGWKLLEDGINDRNGWQIWGRP